MRLDPLYTEAGVNFEQRTCQRPWTYATLILQKVSRTFALNIGVLPNSIKKPVLLAYLFCRMADTVEDDFSLSSAQKKLLLEQFSGIFDAPDWRLAVQVFSQSLPPEWAEGPGFDQLLTYFAEWPFELLFDGPKNDVLFVRKWVQEMCKGMVEYAERRDQEGWFCLRDLNDLDRYCYFVAGTVGFMLCDLFYLHSPWISQKRHSQMKELANSFGLALQVTNIVKDIREDYTRKTSFVPLELYQKVHVDFRDLLSVRPQVLEPVLGELAAKALGHLRDARDYILLIPRLDLRIRMFCLWPMFLALATLERVVSAEPLSENRIKISREEVRAIISRSSRIALSNRKISNYFHQFEESILKALSTKETP